MSSLIEDYALLGDLELPRWSAGTARPNGWSASVRLSRMLGGPARNENPCLLTVRPAGLRRPLCAARLSARYLVHDSKWRTGSGSVRVADFMPSQTGTGPHPVLFGYASMGQ
ncbi:hypothetical protein GCM10010095_83060 [Streptomyces anthocyanicus]|nr:hypothetical protein GCM10010095_83060 [Streptomyces anthocyanicus]GHB88180.1 hypothetical protein GCM10010348_01500 [Streptomyces anthocyanicus]